MKIYVFHRNDLGIAPARRAAFDTETRAQRRFAQTHDGFFADPVQGIAQAYGGRGFAFSGWGWADGGNKYQLTVFVVL
jgi:hypothetical protein